MKIYSKNGSNDFVDSSSIWWFGDLVDAECSVCGWLNLCHFVTSFHFDYVKYTIVYRLSMAYDRMHIFTIESCFIKIIIICIRSTCLCKLIFLWFFLSFFLSSVRFTGWTCFVVASTSTFLNGETQKSHKRFEDSIMKDEGIQATNYIRQAVCRRMCVFIFSK